MHTWYPRPDIDLKEPSKSIVSTCYQNSANNQQTAILTRFIFMPWSFLLLAYFGMGTMMRSEREMGIVLYATGSFCLSCSKPLRTITMPKKPSVYFSLKSTYFLRGNQLNYCGPELLTQEDELGVTFPWTST